MFSRCRETGYAHCAVAFCAALALLACQREGRDFRVQPPALEAVKNRPEVTVESSRDGKIARVTNWYENNAYAISEGKQLYQDFNCAGCHAHGGGATGPPLMDANWIYGSDPAEVYASIRHGRPNGMPAFEGRIPESQIWEIAAYVRSMGGLAPSDAAPGRGDEMQGKPPENSVELQTPKESRPAGNHEPP